MRWMPLVGLVAGCIILSALSTVVTLATRHDLNVVSQVAGIVGTAVSIASLIVAVRGFQRRQSQGAKAARTPIRRAAVALSTMLVVLAIAVPPLVIAQPWSSGQATASPGQPSEPADPNRQLTCNPAVTVFGVTQSGSLFVYPHQEPENGDWSWGAKRSGVGSGWNIGRTLAGPGGVVYSMVAGNGELRRHLWNGNGWDTFDGGAPYRVVGNGWSRYTQAEHRNKVTVDEKGRLYEIDTEGHLKVFVWDDAGDDWTLETRGGKTITTGWNRYDLLVAAGDGVLYARKPNGELFRSRYHAGSDQLVQDDSRVGNGWHRFNRIFSPGGDILYGTRADNGGELLWYRYLEDTKKWANSSRGKLVGTGWYDELDVVATTDDCGLTG